MARTLGLGSVVKVDDDDSGSGFTSVTLSVSAKPIGRERALIDGTTLGDTLATYSYGIEMHSEMTVTVYSEPNDTQHAMVRTLFGAKTQVLWNITYSSADVEQFDGVVSKIEPAEVQIDGLIGETWTIQRMAAVAYS